ncbi:hypothetical protein [Bacteriovorax sp. Seq25_V]|uniref:hypothetical protein n=1 Tax=Bacteriovorax sp. Seq25_V TaxID=1201288 RepID=UPI00038A18DE|nr:hypothetical protein [Bacteriovorax sp. Seq25_V]EQC48056.1 hypothetical protein M900_1096 [Bacteriovorax sp. Seq25_V]
MKTALLLFPLLAMSPLALAKNFEQDRNIVENWKEYYRGNPSFKFSQDPNLEKLENSVEETKKRADEANENVKPFRKIIADEEKAIQTRQAQNKQLDEESNLKLKEKFKIGLRVQSLKKQIQLTSDESKKAALQVELDKVVAEVNTIEARLTEIQSIKASNEQANKVSNEKIAQVKVETKKLEEIAARLSEAHAKSRERRNEYKRKIVIQILRTNHAGSSRGQDNAIEDATDLAQELGSLYGTRDGSLDGEQDGTKEGRQRVRAQAQAEGDSVGARDALDQGSIDGSREGTISGNRRRGSTDGTTTGVSQAQASDASSVGAARGSKEGMNRALQNGSNDGKNLGASQAITKYESMKLKDVLLGGAFSGAFGRTTPTYPDSRGRGNRYNDRGSYKEAILKEAYKDGYEFSYNRTHRRHFNDVIEKVYSDYYSRQYEIMFRNFADRDYPQLRQQTFNEAKSYAFNRDYAGHKNAARARAEEQTFNSPDTNSTDYKVSFENSRATSYQAEYSRIEQDSRAEASEATYNANYPTIKEQNRASEFTKVSEVYTKSSVLKVDSIKVREVGINGVGSEDGIFAPGENKVYDIKISNFGAAEKTDVKVFINGQGYNLGTIPGQTTATITAVAKGLVSSKLGSIDNDQVIITASAANEIEARHFTSSKDGILESDNITNGQVRYPIAMSRLGLSGELIRSKSIGLRVQVENNSKKVYDNVKVVIHSDTDGVISKEFADIRNLTDSKTLTDAVISVKDRDQAYKPINITAYLEKDGVIVGELGQALSVVAKEALDASKDVIIVADASDSLREIQDLLSENGGLDKVGILDTTVRTANDQVLQNGLKGKALLVNTMGKVTETIENMIRNSEELAIVTLDQNGLERFKRHQTIFKDANQLEFHFAGNSEKSKVLFANNRMNKNLKSHIAVIQADERNYKGELEVAKTLAKSNDNMIADVKATVDGNNYFSSDVTKKKMEAVALRAFDEVFQVNKMYDESIGIFGDKDIADLVADDKNLLHNKINSNLGKQADKSNVGLYLAAHNLYHSLKEGLEEHKPFEKEMRSAVTKRLFTFKKLFKKIVGPLSEIDGKMSNLKKFDKGLHGKLTSKNGHHKPYRLQK